MDGIHETRTARGFTLVELLVAVALVAILLALALPTFDALAERKRMRSIQSLFQGTLAHARQAAVTRNRRVTLCPGSAADGCLDAGTWHEGWLMFVDRNGDRKPDAGEPVLLERKPLRPDASLNSSRYRRKITFQPTGTAGGSNATFTVCAPGATPRAVVLSRLGRIRAEQGEPADCPAAHRP